MKGGNPPPAKDAPSEAESGTTAGVTDPALIAAIEEEKRLIEEAQARIAAITGGRRSRAGSKAGSQISKGSATMTVSQSVSHTKTATTNFTPTTFKEPKTGKIRVLNPSTRIYGEKTGNPLMESLPDFPNIPDMPPPPSPPPHGGAAGRH